MRTLDPAECCPEGQEWDPATESCLPDCPDDRVYNPTTGLCERSCAAPTPFYNPNTDACEACPAETPIYDPDLRVCVGGCPGGTQAGGDAPFTGAFELGRKSRVFSFSYQTFSVRDRVIVRHDGDVLYDSDCVGEQRTVNLSYAGDSTQVVVQVIPNCAGSSGTAWTFTVACPTLGREAPACEPRWAEKSIRGLTCTQIIAGANRLSDRVLDAQGRPRVNAQFTRAETELFYDAVECRTGLPAWMMRAHSSGEALGKYYADPYPRQILEPCAQVYNQNGTGGFIELFDRYYGDGWPLFALDAGFEENILLPKGEDGYPPDIDIPADFRCSGATPPAPMDPAWTPVWPRLAHTAINDDRISATSGRNTFGLGITQVTYFIEDTTDENGVTRGGLLRVGRQISLVNDYREHVRSSDFDLYPLGGGLPGSAPNLIPMEPQQNRIEDLLFDPQYNILALAQLAANKRQQASGNDDGAVGECLDQRYGRILVYNPEVWPEAEREANFLSNMGNLGRGVEYFTDVRDHDFASGGRCFCDDNYRLVESSCAYTFAHAFANACNDLASYCAGVVPAGDPCE